MSVGQKTHKKVYTNPLRGLRQGCDDLGVNKLPVFVRYISLVPPMPPTPTMPPTDNNCFCSNEGRMM